MASFLGSLSSNGDQMAVSISRFLCCQELQGKEHSSDLVLGVTDGTHLNQSLWPGGQAILSGTRPRGHAPGA